MTRARINKVFEEILKEYGQNHLFADRIDAALGAATTLRATGRRTTANLDPMAVLEASGESGLRTALARLDLEQLKDIVAEFGMDQSRLVMKWTTRDRISEHITKFAHSRIKKGDAFRS